MTRKPKSNQTLTPLELQIMQVLWDLGPSTVNEVQAKLPGELAYTSVQTMLNVLFRKNKVKRIPEGRAYRYQPIVTRERAAGSAVHDLVKRMFGGSTEAMLMAMVNTHQISADDLKRAAQHLAVVDREHTKEG